MTPPSNVERVARAIYDIERKLYGQVPRDWGPLHKEMYFAVARAAIAAMKKKGARKK